jgi:hypothetical protein
MVTETLLRDLKTQTLNPSAGSGAAQKTSALGAAIDRSTIRQRSPVLICFCLLATLCVASAKVVTLPAGDLTK